jgi:hypothetical protein
LDAIVGGTFCKFDCAYHVGHGWNFASHSTKSVPLFFSRGVDMLSKDWSIAISDDHGAFATEV